MFPMEEMTSYSKEIVAFIHNAETNNKILTSLSMKFYFARVELKPAN